jgi:hypothetical protein
VIVFLPPSCTHLLSYLPCVFFPLLFPALSPAAHGMFTLAESIGLDHGAAPNQAVPLSIILLLSPSPSLLFPTMFVYLWTPPSFKTPFLGPSLLPTPLIPAPYSMLTSAHFCLPWPTSSTTALDSPASAFSDYRNFAQANHEERMQQSQARGVSLHPPLGPAYIREIQTDQSEKDPEGRWITPAY